MWRRSPAKRAMAWRRAEILAGSVDGSVRRFDVRMGRLFTDDLHHSVTCVQGAQARRRLRLWETACDRCLT